MNRNRYILLNGAVLGISAVMASTWRETAIDRCLENGGCWNYSDSKCEKQRYAAYGQKRRLPAWHRIGIRMENEELREYQVIWWTDDPACSRERLTVLAISLDDASKQVKNKFGSNINTSIWNEEDAAKPR